MNRKPAKTLLSTGIALAVLMFPLSLQAAAPPKFGLSKPVKVVCIQFNNVPVPRKTACHDWVDQFNREVSPWYQRTSDNRESFQFALAPFYAVLHVRQATGSVFRFHPRLASIWTL